MPHALSVVCGMVVLLAFGLVVLAEAKQKRDALAELRAAAETFAKAYAEQDYKTMYQLLSPNYRSRVPLWEYRDFVEYPPITDGYIKVDVAEAYVLGNGKFGKVIMKISIYETIKEKTTGRVNKRQQELLETQDWVNLDGKWYKIEKIE